MVRPRVRGDARARQRAESLIPYRKLAVPCCIECNTEFLSNIETAVRPLFRRGDVVHREERFSLARWLSKILIGVHVKETSLLFDRSQPHRGPIIDPGVIDHLRQCHFVLQSARKRASFVCLHGNFPFSFYFLQGSRVQEGSQIRSLDKYRRTINCDKGRSTGRHIRQRWRLSNACRFERTLRAGTRGVVGIQLRKIAARVHYQASLRDALHFL